MQYNHALTLAMHYSNQYTYSMYLNQLPLEHPSRRLSSDLRRSPDVDTKSMISLISKRKKCHSCKKYSG